MKDSTSFMLETYPYSMKNLFSLHDISKEKYKYLLPEKYNESYAFIRNYEGAEWSETGHSVNIKDYDLMLVYPDFPEISFYTKLVLSENLQTIRTFFLTECFTFLLAVLGFCFYELFWCIYRRKYGKSFYLSKTGHLKLFTGYALLSLVTILTIIVICKSPTKEINTCDYHETTKFAWFKPYDISQTYYRINIAADKIIADTIIWSSDEIVEFSAMQHPAQIISGNSLKFINCDRLAPFKNDFYTKNLESKNVQEIRLFLLTTIFLLFMARCYIHLKSFFRAILCR